jgi:hypothetical protein
VKDSPVADKSREGYYPLYPSHLKAGENIPNAWLDNLNETGTLEYEGSVKEGGLTLYKYFVNKTRTDIFWIEHFKDWKNCTLTSTKTILLEPLSGLLVYVQEETFNQVINGEPSVPLVYLEYGSTAKSKTDGLATAKTAHDALQLLYIYIPLLLAVITVILIIGLAFNVRRLKRKSPSQKK